MGYTCAGAVVALDDVEAPPQQKLCRSPSAPRRWRTSLLTSDDATPDRGSRQRDDSSQYTTTRAWVRKRRYTTLTDPGSRAHAPAPQKAPSSCSSARSRPAWSNVTPTASNLSSW